jgi:translation initiation factor 2D
MLSGSDQRILWVRIADRLFPTVYTLWSYPKAVPLLHTHPEVVERLKSGAELMIPGLAKGPPFPAGAVKGAIVAVASTARPSVPLVVGVCETDVSGLGRVVGEKGVAVRTVSWVGDELWAWSAVGRPGGMPPEKIDGWWEEESDLVRQTGELNIAEAEPAPESAEASGEPDEESTDQKQWTTKGLQHHSVADQIADLEIKALTKHSKALSCMAFMLPERADQHHTMDWTFRSNNRSSCRVLFSHIYRPLPRQISKLSRSRRRPGRR